jgi:ABC-type spermidine/putrescine transport system permease subunit I
VNGRGPARTFRWVTVPAARSRTLVLSLLVVVLTLGGLVAAPTVAGAASDDDAIPFTEATG